MSGSSGEIPRPRVESCFVFFAFPSEKHESANTTYEHPKLENVPADQVTRSRVISNWPQMRSCALLLLKPVTITRTLCCDSCILIPDWEP